MFHYVDKNEENLTKMSTVKKYRKQNESDRGLGATVQVAESVDNLLKSCEDIETQATIVLKSVDQSILRNTPSIPQDNIYRFYVVLRQGIKTLSSTIFRNIPKVDIKNLTDYRDILITLYSSLNESLLKINDIAYKNEPLNKRTVEEYERQTRKKYTRPVSAEKLQQYLKDRGNAEAKFNTELVEMRQRREEGIALLETIANRKDELEPLLESVLQQKEGKINLYRRNEAELERTTDRKIIVKLTNYNEANARDIEILTQREQEYLRELKEIEDLSKRIPKELDIIQNEIVQKEVGLTGDLKDETLPLTDAEYKLQQRMQKGADIVDKDYELIMKHFDIFINTLNHGITSYTSGVSGKFNKSQDTNYRTPSESIISQLEGSGKNTGKQIHKRFL